MLLCPTGSSTLTHTTSTGELEEHNRTATGAIAVASTSADVTVSSVTAVTIHRLSEEQRVQVTNLRNAGLDPNTSKDGLSPHQADTQSTRRRPRNAEQIERTNELAVVTHRGIGCYFTCARLVNSQSFILVMILIRELTERQPRCRKLKKRVQSSS